MWLLDSVPRGLADTIFPDFQLAFQLSALQLMCSGHRILSHLNVAAILGTGENSLIGYTHSREIEGLVRLQFTGFLTVGNCQFVFALQCVDAA